MSEQEKNPDIQDADQQNQQDAAAGDKKAALSKAQKKKAKAKAKAGEEKQPDQQNAADEEDKEDKDEKGGAKGKKGKKGAAAGGRSAIAKLAQEKLKAKQEEEKRIKELEEQEERERLERERIEKEEQDRIKAEEQRKKEIKRQQIEELKKQGKWLSEKDRIKQEQAERTRQQLILQGLIKPDQEYHPELNEDGTEKKVKTMVVRNKKKKDKKKDQVQQNDNEVADKEQIQDKQIDQQPQKDDNKKSNVLEQSNINTTMDKTVNADDEDQEDVVDDWENADIDEVASKIANKGLKPGTTNGKAIRMDAGEEDNDDDDLSQAQLEKKKLLQNKEQIKMRNAGKNTKEEEKQGAGGDVFAKAAEQQSQVSMQRKQKLAEMKAKQEARKQEIHNKIQTKKASGKDAKLRCPIICILGHVDTGKTLILDKLRRTNVQAGEAGGITQQIGATYFPEEFIKEHLERMGQRLPKNFQLQIPGFLCIDTPGHESFTNLRSRGSSLCDIAILVVDIMHGLEKQTLESLQLIRQKKTPFVVALNKIDRMYQWVQKEYRNVRDSLEIQESSVKFEFKDRLQKTILAFAEEGINACLYWENEDTESYVSLCPTSAITGEGLPDLMTYITQICQTKLRHQLKEKEDFECTVLEVKVIEGHGTTIDVILVNGRLTVGDTIVLSGFNGPIVTTIRALLTPQPLKEMRVKGEYIHHQYIQGSMGIKISAPGLENAMAGAELYKADTEEEIENFKAQIADDLVDIMNKYVDKSNQGVCVQASTLGSLEALLEFLKQMKIPVTSINIGPVHKKDVLKAMKSLTGEGHQKEFATILAFDVKVTPEAEEFATDNGIKIFTANIIYHLFDSFTEYVKQCRDERKSEEGVKAVFPCLLEMVKGAMFHAKDPIIIGVTVKAGILKVGTPLCIPDKGNLRIGHVESIELNSKPIQMAKPQHGGVAMKVTGDSSIMYGRHFDDTNQIASILTRDSIDALKNYFKDDLSKDDWKLVIQLKKMFGIP